MLAIETHSFATGHDFSNHAVEQALTKGAAEPSSSYLALLAGLALAVGMVVMLLNALRVGPAPALAGRPRHVQRRC